MTDEGLQRLVDLFYARVREDALLGPVGLSNGDGGTRPAGLSYLSLTALANDHVMAGIERVILSRDNS